MENQGDHEGRLARVEAKIDMILDQMKVRKDAGEAPLCIMHRAELSEFKVRLDKAFETIDAVKARVWYFSGAAAAAGYFADKLFSK